MPGCLLFLSGMHMSISVACACIISGHLSRLSFSEQRDRRTHQDLWRTDCQNGEKLTWNQALGTWPLRAIRPSAHCRPSDSADRPSSHFICTTVFPFQVRLVWPYAVPRPTGIPCSPFAFSSIIHSKLTSEFLYQGECQILLQKKDKLLTLALAFGEQHLMWRERMQPA